MAKGKEKLAARELRRGGESIGVIAKTLHVSKDSVSRWCYDIQLTSEQVAVLVQRDRIGGVIGRERAAQLKREERINREHKYAALGKESIGLLSTRELFLVGLSLYWAEGSKKRGRVRLCNSDPRLIKLYVKWLETCFGIKHSALTCRVTINEIHLFRRQEIEQYWSDVLGIPQLQFTKTTVIHARMKKVYEHMENYFGVLDVTAQKSANLNYQICGGIEQLGNLMVKYPLRQGSLAG